MTPHALDINALCANIERVAPKSKERLGRKVLIIVCGRTGMFQASLMSRANALLKLRANWESLIFRMFREHKVGMN